MACVGRQSVAEGPLELLKGLPRRPRRGHHGPMNPALDGTYVPRTLKSLSVVVLALALVAPGGAAEGASPTSGTPSALAPAAPPVAAAIVPVPSARRYTVCKPGPDSLTYTGYYPYSFQLSTAFANTRNRRIKSSVASVQRLYNAWLMWENVSGRALKVDGLYGARTALSIKKFQRVNHIPVTGRIGERTWRKLGGFCSIFH
jgi:peptidoglycan hydrolase-like protein with peptidoglycan-binding domain